MGASIFPRSGPRPGAPTSEAEVHEALARSLPAGWTAWHSLTLQTLKGDREADFVVVHPELGGVVVEVKGGRVGIVDGRWYRNGRPMDRNPLDQVHGAKRALIARAASDGHRLPTIGVALVFPETQGSAPAGIGGLSGRTFVQTDLPRLGALLAELVRREDKGFRADPRWVGWLHDVWGESWVPSLRPSARIEADAADRVPLDARQRMLLELLDLNSRVLVQGVAGTGKTMLALEAARRRARLGERVLLCCFTRALAGALRQALSGTGVEVWHVRALARDMLERAGVALGDPTRAEWETLSARAAEHLDVVVPFDSLIVDEAQDLGWADWDLVTSLAEGKRLWAFADEGQGFWDDRPLDAAAFSTIARLGRPYRTPRPLFEVAAACLAEEPDEASLTLAREERRLSVLLTTEKKGAASRVREDVRKLLAEGVAPRDIAVLSLRGQDHGGVPAALADNGRLPVVPADHPDAAEEVVADTFLRFKGLERPIVYITDLGAVADKRGHRLYVALTRALTEARIVCASEDLAAVPELAGLLR